MEETGEKLNPYVVPSAIVVAGLLIAGAVVYVGGGSSRAPLGGTPDSAGGGVLSPTNVAKAVKLNEKGFGECLASGRYSDKVSADLEEAYSVGLGGTPTSVIVTPDGEQYFLEGALPADVIAQYVDAALINDDAALVELETQYGVRGIEGTGVTPDDVRAVDDTDHIRGDMGASVKIIEYSDLECPFCKRFHPEMKSVVDQYGNGVAWIYRHLPLEQIHPSARPLAEGSECATELGGNDKFWEYVDYVFEN